MPSLLGGAGVLVGGSGVAVGVAATTGVGVLGAGVAVGWRCKSGGVLMVVDAGGVLVGIAQADAKIIPTRRINQSFTIDLPGCTQPLPLYG